MSWQNGTEIGSQIVVPRSGPLRFQGKTEIGGIGACRTRASLGAFCLGSVGRRHAFPPACDRRCHLRFNRASRVAQHPLWVCGYLVVPRHFSSTSIVVDSDGSPAALFSAKFTALRRSHTCPGAIVQDAKRILLAATAILLRKQ